MSTKDIISENLIFKQELNILRRQQPKRLYFKPEERLFYSLLSKVSDIKSHISLVKPETILKWQRHLIKSFWTFPSYKSRVGRPAVPKYIKNLVLRMKNDNIFWGYKRIQGELLKLNICLDHTTIRNIILHFRHNGKIKKGLTWSKFLKNHVNSIYAIDFFTVDTILNTRFYVFFIISHKTRENE